jgi:signal transduction protein with GAF and PtsI domain
MAPDQEKNDSQDFNYFTALYEVARVVNSSLEPEHVLQEIVRCVTRAMNVEACSLRLLASRGKVLEMGASYGLSEGYIHKGPVIIEESIVDQQALKGNHVWIENAQVGDHFQYRKQAEEEGIKSVLVLPLIIEGKPIGVMRVYTKDTRMFSDKDISFLEAAANLSAIAIDNARHHQALKTKCDLITEHKYRIDDN